MVPSTLTGLMAGMALVAALVAAPESRPPVGSADCELSALGAQRRHPLPSGIGEVSGMAASLRYPGWAWMVRDSGNPASLFALRLRQGGPPTVREVKVVGARNRDWEDVVQARTSKGTWLYVIESGQSGKDRFIYRIPEPDPGSAWRVAGFERFRYRYPGNVHYNTEAALFHAGRLFLVTKTSPARLYRFDRPLSKKEVNRPRFVGPLAGATNVSVVRLSPDGRFLVSANHQRVFVHLAQAGMGPLARFTSRLPVLQRRLFPGDNVEAGDFFPTGGCRLVFISESRNVYQVGPRCPVARAPELPGPNSRPGCP